MCTYVLVVSCCTYTENMEEMCKTSKIDVLSLCFTHLMLFFGCALVDGHVIDLKVLNKTETLGISTAPPGKQCVGFLQLPFSTLDENLSQMIP